jgi:hypothetical protein
MGLGWLYVNTREQRCICASLYSGGGHVTAAVAINALLCSRLSRIFIVIIIIE